MESSRATALGRTWTVEDAEELYRIPAWGKGYFAVNAAGHIVVRPEKNPKREIDLMSVVEHCDTEGLRAPLVVRFSNLLTHRLRHLRDAFDRAINEHGYEGGYLSVYPIKVNQQRKVVEEVYRGGAEHGFGLEVGSKPELLAVLAMTDCGSRPILCNGFKDDDYIGLVMLGAKLGREIVTVVEKMDELDLLLKHARREGVEPQIGVRIKIAAEGAGRWRESSGAKSKFGLFTSEVVELFDRLRAEGLEHCLKLVHCHPGSQLHDIRRVKQAIGELAHVYIELVRMGASGLRYLDVGGGLGVDYDGTQTSFASSMNYTVEQYAEEVVYRIASTCSERDVAHPTIITESGRAVAAFQSLLVVNVLGRSRLDDFEVDEDLSKVDRDELPPPIQDLIVSYEAISERYAVECYHDAIQAYEQTIQLFNMGYVTLEQRAFGERLFWSICAGLLRLTEGMNRVPEELAGLGRFLADIYFCNLSIFQSLPDSWAIDQLFPILPIHRLDEEPTRQATLADITCDSDGKINQFVGLRDVEKTLSVHPIHGDDKYYLGIFLTGAYQETLGDLHNLFGDTHVVHVGLQEQGEGWRIEETVEGDTAAEVLGYLQYDIDDLIEKVRTSCASAARAGRLDGAEAESLVHRYQRELAGYTYLEPEVRDGHVEEAGE